jgi:hypothetical protein
MQRFRSVRIPLAQGRFERHRLQSTMKEYVIHGKPDFGGTLREVEVPYAIPLVPPCTKIDSVQQAWSQGRSYQSEGRRIEP